MLGYAARGDEQRQCARERCKGVTEPARVGPAWPIGSSCDDRTHGASRQWFSVLVRRVAPAAEHRGRVTVLERASKVLAHLRTSIHGLAPWSLISHPHRQKHHDDGRGAPALTRDGDRHRAFDQSRHEPRTRHTSHGGIATRPGHRPSANDASGGVPRRRELHRSTHHDSTDSGTIVTAATGRAAAVASARDRMRGSSCRSSRWV